MLTEQTRRAIAETREKGATSRISVLPLKEFGFVLNKGEFRDALRHQHAKELCELRSQCPCSHQYNVNHALYCKRGGFVIIKHNNIRDSEANLINQVYSDVEVEPHFQSINWENINGLTGDDARPDIRARSVWQNEQNAFFLFVLQTLMQIVRVIYQQLKILGHMRQKKKQKKNASTTIVLWT